MMNLVLQTPSLEHIAGVKIVAHLWTQPDVLPHVAVLFDPSVTRDYFYIPEMQWTALENQVKVKVFALSLPQLYKTRLMSLIKPMGKEILTWCQDHCVIRHLLVERLLLNDQVCWTMHGTVDYKRTVELILKDDELGLASRYAFACLNCFEDEASELFGSVGAEGVREIVRKVIVDRHVSDQSCMMAYFSYTFNADVAGLHAYFISKMLRGESIHKYLFKVGLRRGCRASCDYFFAKLNRREREQVFEDSRKTIWECGEFPARSLMCYWSLMNEEQRRRMFPECICIVGLLWCLLEWPMQSLFMEAVQCGWSYNILDKESYSRVLSQITLLINRGHLHYDDYSQLFWELWRLGPAKYKRHFLDQNFHFFCLIETKREAFIRLALYQAPAHQFLEAIAGYGSQYHISPVLLDESAISDAALVECKQTAVLSSWNDKTDEEKRLRSKYVSHFVDCVMEARIKRRDVFWLGT